VTRLPRFIFVVWSKTTGPLHAYRVSIHADQHANSMLGVEVTACRIAENLLAVNEVHVVWAPDPGPVMAFADPIEAHRFARDKTAYVDVAVGCCELRYDLPDAVMDDLEVDEYESDQITPIEISDIDDVTPDRIETVSLARTKTRRDDE
jgi:hypothetical protein